MPRFDRTGPFGRGARTGRGRGPCGRGYARGYAGRCYGPRAYEAGYGRGYEQGYGRRSGPFSLEEEKAFLEEEKAFLEARIKELGDILEDEDQ